MPVTLRLVLDSGIVVHEQLLTEGRLVTVDSDGRVIPAMPPASDALDARLFSLEMQVGRLCAAEAGRAPQVSSPASGALDAARARKFNAEAEKLERETQLEYGPPPDDGASPVQVKGWDVSSRSDLGTVHAKLSDHRGRAYVLTLLPDPARELAESLLSGARFAERGGT